MEFDAIKNQTKAIELKMLFIIEFVVGKRNRGFLLGISAMRKHEIC